MRKYGGVLLLALSLSGCLHVEVSGDSDKLDKSNPDGTRQMAFWAGGYGVHHFDVKTACEGKGQFSQFQLKQRFLDGFLQAVTLGIYSPMTANVHCKG